MDGFYRIFGSGNVAPFGEGAILVPLQNIAHEWVPRSAATAPEFQKYAKIPVIPLVVTPDERGLQDLTPLMERSNRPIARPPPNWPTPRSHS